MQVALRWGTRKASRRWIKSMHPALSRRGFEKNVTVVVRKSTQDWIKLKHALAIFTRGDLQHMSLPLHGRARQCTEYVYWQKTSDQLTESQQEVAHPNDASGTPRNCANGATSEAGDVQQWQWHVGGTGCSG